MTKSVHTAGTSQRRIIPVVRLLAVFVLVVAGTELAVALLQSCGWDRIGRLGISVPMAIGLFPAGWALWSMQQPRRARLIFVTVAAWGAGHLVWVLTQEVEAPERVLPLAAAIGLICLGLGAALSARGTGWSTRVGQGLLFLVVTFATLELVIVLHRFEQPGTEQNGRGFNGIAALSLLALSVGAVLARRDVGVGKLFGLRSMTGSVFRSALPTAIFVPLLIGWISAIGRDAGWWGPVFATSLTAVLCSGVLFFVLAVVTFLARETESMLLLRDRALESTEVAVVIADAGSADLPIVEVNTAFEKLTGYTFADVQGRNCRFLNQPDREQDQLEEVRTAIRDGECCDVVLRNFKKDGTEFWNRLSISPVFDSFDAITHFVGIARDVSDDVARRREREAMFTSEKQARQDAERALSARDEFLGIVSHELRSPLHSARLWAALLLDVDSKVEPREVAQHVVKSIDAQSRLVGDLLDVSRFTTERRLDLEWTVQDLVPLIKSTIETLRPVAEEGQVFLETTIPDSPVTARIDADRFAQIVRNLVENAIKFTPAKGQVFVELAAVDGRAVLRVVDTGCGLSVKEMEHVFDRFWQRDENRARKRGLGLGLTIVNHLVRSHDGDISVHSDGPDQGTVLRVSLPLHAPVEEVVAQPHRRKRAEVGRQALVIDDRSSARFALSSILTAHGFEVVSAASAEEAIELVADHRFSLLISDIMLPGEDGHALVRELREMPNFGDDALAIAVSGQSSPADRRRAMQSGFDGFLGKPVLTDQLLAMVSAGMESMTSDDESPNRV